MPIPGSVFEALGKELLLEATSYVSAIIGAYLFWKGRPDAAAVAAIVAVSSSHSSHSLTSKSSSSQPSKITWAMRGATTGLLGLSLYRHFSNVNTTSDVTIPFGVAPSQR